MENGDVNGRRTEKREERERGKGECFPHKERTEPLGERERERV